MLISTTDFIPNKDIVEFKGLVKGTSVRAKHIGKDFLAGLKHIVGGEINTYKEMLDESRDFAISRMIKEAEDLGANAITSCRLSSSQVMQGASEMVAYGTAVVVQDKDI
jgi:uncharacterized protein YbjQ (UPF0145 family)